MVLMNDALALRESNGAELRNCSSYICERITRERADTNASETMWKPTAS